MRELKLDYKVSLQGHFPQPLCDIMLLGEKGPTPIQALVDSGAVRPIFPMKAAEDAGIDLAKGIEHPIQYGWSDTPGRICRVRFQLSEGTEIESSVVFVERLQFPYGLLGRVGFFDRFDEVNFVHRDKRRPYVVFRR